MTKKQLFVAALLAMAAGFGGAALYRSLSLPVARATGPKTMVLGRLVIVDQSGRPRASLQVVKGAVVFTMRDQKGRSRLALAVTGAGLAEIGLLDDRNRPRLVLTGEQGRLYGLVIRDARSRVRAALGLGGYEEPSLMIFDAKGKALFTAPAKTGR
ncbi:MAG: hypothetical protein KJ621_01055 [Proteobacteria bacterium]|nr:hypothetical protein [Pseudomonadota bacterium]MBU1740510.1 hypothetical protein [Pseudomonadota bacterium]